MAATPIRSYPGFPDIIQLVAYDTGFAALSSTGQVWTWGDERFAACLGRKPTSPSSPATAPGLVEDLMNLPTGPIVKLAGGGYVLAALTAGNDLYCWGHPGRAAVANLSGLGVTDTPAPIVIDDHDIADIAVGESHLVALTTTGDVFVIGSNSNGQLGLGSPVEVAETWTRLSSLDGALSADRKVKGVAAGPRNSFLIIRKHP